jgi:hypothetical protein
MPDRDKYCTIPLPYPVSLQPTGTDKLALTVVWSMARAQVPVPIKPSLATGSPTAA